MKIPTSLALTVLLSGSLWLSGCSTSPGSPMSRIDANRAEYETWDLDVKEAVLDGRVEKGMTPKQVEVAVGRPTRVEYREGRSGSQEIWIYTRKTGSGLQGSTVSIGTYGVGVSTTAGQSYRDEYEVVFEKGQVVNSDVPAATAR